MKVFINKKTSFTSDSVCAIGGFDGIHRGHLEIIKHAKKLTGSRKKLGIITFIPLPIFVLKRLKTLYLTPKEEKEEILRDLGIDFIYYFKFNKSFSQLNPADFVKLVYSEIAPSIVIVGENFRFGKDRKGTVMMFKELAKDYFSVEIIADIEDEGTISSTRIRELLLLGNIKAANHLLGREYSISGRVIKGRGKGTKLGFPTINIRVQEEKFLPLDGIYKVKTIYDKKELLGAMFCYHNLIEIYIINFSGNLYQKEVKIKLLKRIRDIEKFPDDDSLRTAIARDVEKVKKEA